MDSESVKEVAGNCRQVSKEPREIASKTLSKATWLKVQGLRETTIKNDIQLQNLGAWESLHDLRRKFSRTENDEMFEMETNVLIWRLFESTTMKWAIHFGLEYD